MLKFKKEFQLWQDNGEGFFLTEYDTLDEAVIAEKYTNKWYITKAIREKYTNVKFNNLEEDANV